MVTFSIRDFLLGILVAVIVGATIVMPLQEKNKQVIEKNNKQILLLKKRVEVLEGNKMDLENEKNAIHKRNKKFAKKNEGLLKENLQLKKKVKELKKKKMNSIKKTVHQKRITNTQINGKKNAKKVRPKPIVAKRAATNSSNTTMTVVATGYIAMCDTQCTGITATGKDVRNSSKDYRIIAVDPSVIPLHSVVELIVNGKSWGNYTAEDTGGAIKGHRIDILMKTHSEAVNFGKQTIQVRIIKKG